MTLYSTMNDNLRELFLHIVGLGIGHSDGGTPQWPKVVDWDALIALAEQQGLSGVLADGIDCLPKEVRPTKPAMLQLIGSVLQNYEYRYGLYRRAIAEMATFYNEHGFKMMVLKGYACSLDWPKPEHRPTGDIDIWLFGKYKEADDLLEQEKCIKVDHGHHHHTMFYWREFMIENHYDFVNVYAHKSNRRLENVFKHLGMDDSHATELHGETVYLPSANLNALFLLRHMLIHFASEGLSIRQILDWAFFVEKHTKEVDWEWLIGVLKKYHMIEFYNTINAICVGDLGFDAKIFPSVQFRPDLKDKVLKDILYPKYSASEPSSLIPRLLYKYRRWQGNAWKHELCYSESRWSAFWNGLWAHLLKPASL